MFTVVDVIIFIQLLFVSTGEALTEEVELQLPQIVVAGSARISLSVLGKINHCVVVGRRPFSSDDAAVCCNGSPLFLCRGHPGSGPQQPGWTVADAVWVWGAEYGPALPQYLHPGVPEEHRAAHASHPRKGHQVPH